MKRSVLILALAVSIGASSADAALVRLKDGSQVRGTVVSATAQELQLHTPDGMLTINTDRIQSVDYSNDTGAARPAAPSGEEGVTPPPPMRGNHARRQVESAWDTTGKQLFSLGFGLGTPVSRVNFSGAGGGTADNGDTGLFMSTQYGYQLSPHFATGFNLEYLGRSDSGSFGLVPEALTNVSGNSLLMMATLKFTIVPHGPARPYLLAGFGANRTSTIIDATPNPGFAWSDTGTAETRTLVDDAKWGPASTFRVGVDFPLQTPSVFSLEFGYIGIHNSQYPALPAGKDLGLDHVTGNLSALEFSARWGWRF